jgi:4-amino-4-deoxy-L-arabinose transferase-like glycosyltransferase
MQRSLRDDRAVTLHKWGGHLPFLLLTGGSALVLLAGLGRLPLFGRDEALYAEAAREMLASGDWVTPRVNGGVFFEKPPLYYWLAASSYWLLGVSPLAARLPAALMGIVTVAATAALGTRIWGRRAGLLAGIALATSLQLAMIGRMGILDVPLMCLVTFAVAAYAGWRRRGGMTWALAFGGLTGLAVLLKGFAGGLAPVVAVVHALVHRSSRRPASLGSVALAALAFALVAAPWFLAMAARHGGGFGSTLFLREHVTRMVQPMQGHGGPVVYYVGLIAVSFFPWAMFLPTALLRRVDPCHDERSFWRSLLVVWFVVVLVPFSLVRTKLPGYVTPLFPAMSLLVGTELDRRLRDPGRWPWTATIIGSLLLGALISLLPVAGMRLGARVGAAGEVWRLVVPSAIWAGGYAGIAIGASFALFGRVRSGLAAMVAGQLMTVAALLAGILPVLSPYLGGGPAQLAEIARSELPDSRVVLYDTRPETVAFVLGRNVPAYSGDMQKRVIDALEYEDTALVAPLKRRDFWEKLPARRVWRSGDRVLLDIPRPEDDLAGTSRR